MKRKIEPILILLAGGSGSGKSTVSQELIKNLPCDFTAVTICQDSYYLDNSKRPNINLETYNYDHPTAFDWKLMLRQIKLLLANKSINLPIYDYTTHSRLEKTKKIKPADVIILEGIHALHNDEINQLAELKIFVDTPMDESFIRRLERDVKARGRELSSVINQWRVTVKPMYIAFIEPSKTKADIVIPWSVYKQKSIQILREGLIGIKKNEFL